MKKFFERYSWVTGPFVVLVLAAIGFFTLGDFKNLLSGDYAKVILGITLIYTLFTVLVGVIIKDDPLTGDSNKRKAGAILAVLFFGLIIRLYIAMSIHGYVNDMLCWTSWSYAAGSKGFFSIYINQPFLDYPPGYLYILHIIGSISKMTGIAPGSDIYNLLLKVPAILCDIAMAFIIYRVCTKRLMQRVGLLLAFLYIVNPLTLLDSAAWGQVDSILTLFVAGYLLMLYKEKIFAGTLIFVAGLLMKPQMLFFGPVLAVVFIKYVLDKGWLKGLKTFLISFLSGIALFALVVAPFTQGRAWYWIFEKYMGTINSYNYITLNAANFYGMRGLNWQPTDTMLGGMSLGAWGMLGLVATIVIFFIAGFMNKDRKNIFMLSAMLMTGIYAFGLKMHERYLFPVAAILILAFIFDNRKAILGMFTVITAAMFVNVAQILAITHAPPEDPMFVLTSAAVVVTYLWMCIYCFKEAVRSQKPIAPVPDETAPIEETITPE